MLFALAVAGCAGEGTTRFVSDLAGDETPLPGGESGSLQEEGPLWTALPADVQETFAYCGVEGFASYGEFISLLSYDDMGVALGETGVDGRYLGGAGADDIISQAILDEISYLPLPSQQSARACDNIRSRVVIGDVTVPGTYSTAAGNTIKVDNQGRVARRRAKVILSTANGQVVDVAYAIPGPASAIEKQSISDVVAENYPQLAALLAATPDLLAGLEQEHLTLFAPTAAAFAKLPAERYQELLSNETLRREVLKRHISDTPVLYLYAEQSVPDLNGGEATFEWWGPTVNGMLYNFTPTFADGMIIFEIEGIFGETPTYGDELNAEYAALYGGN